MKGISPVLPTYQSVGVASTFRKPVKFVLLGSLLLLYTLAVWFADAPFKAKYRPDLKSLSIPFRWKEGWPLAQTQPLSETEELLQATSHAANQLALLARASPVPQAPYKLALCSLARNEARYLEEWILYHYMLGFDHFVIQDHASTDDTMHVLQPYIASGLVEVQHVDPNATLLQIEYSVHSRCFNGSAVNADWIATFDVDESLTSTFQPNFEIGFRPSPLQSWFDERTRQKQAVIIISRFTFGPNNRIEPPPEPLGQADWFTERTLEDHEKAKYGPKAIGKTGYYNYPERWAHHWLEPIQGWKRVQPNKIPVDEFLNTMPVSEPIRLSHFETRSLQECLAKSQDPGQAGSWRALNNINETCNSRMADDPKYHAEWQMQDYLQRDSIYNQAARLIRSQGGLL